MIAAMRAAFIAALPTEEQRMFAQMWIQGSTALIGLIQGQNQGAFMGWPAIYTNVLHGVWQSILDNEAYEDTAELIGNGYQWADINLYIAQHGWPAKQAFVTWCRFVRTHAMLNSLLSNDFAADDNSQDEHLEEMLNMWEALTTKLNLVLDPLGIQL